MQTVQKANNTPCYFLDAPINPLGQCSSTAFSSQEYNLLILNSNLSAQ
jgi:hypothetical protein